MADAMTVVSHVVLMKPRSDLSSADRDAFVAAFERAVREIPSIRGVRIGRRVTHGAGYEASAPDTADYLAVIDFDDVTSLQAYLRHPAHEALGALFGQVLSSGIAYDFEAGGIEALRTGGLFGSGREND
jgi:Stress responsive A/B Barrel Domain